MADLRKIVRDAIVGAIPPDEACLADEEACFEQHPVHLGWSVEGEVRAVYARVDGLVDIVLAALEEAGRLTYESFVASGPPEEE